ncbi:hypothetical protein BG015_001753 [Linnemannia schmuckeri]|uniref:F-box domain-containing protein n=1 Tax=Linnemannia schmuckeri TaxID=64567 RepID=A0A9P5RPD1_9FUNG|nr:hypothetical protein BG015_001753 [Linnemannia schmuckeri]
MVQATTATKPPTPPADTPPSLILAFQGLDSSAQMAFLNDLVLHCTTPQLAHLTNIIAPMLKRDFLRDLPLELAHHILSMIDEPKSLARVSQVSKFWHQLVETEDWIWRAQCIRQFGPTSCSSLPSPRAHMVPPTSYLYTTSPTSLDAVSSTLKSLSLNNHPNSSSSTSSSPASHRLSLGPGSMGSSAASSAHPSPASMKPGDLSLLAAAAAATIPTSCSPAVIGSPSRLALSALSSLDNQSAILTTALTLDDDFLKQQQQQQRAQQQELQELQEQRQLQQQQYARQLRMATSYKAYFKRRFMIDRNWISGHHSLISYTTPETGVVTSLQFDHHHIVVGCDNSRIQIFETTSGRLIRTLQGHLGGVWALEFVKGVGPAGEKMLVSGGCDRELRVWDMNTGKCRLVMPGHTGTIRCLKLHQLPVAENSSNSSSTANNTNNNNDYDYSDGGYSYDRRYHQDPQDYYGQEGDDGAPPRIKRRAQHQYHPHRPYLAITGSRDATLRVWDLQTGENKFVLQGHRDSVRCIEAHGDRLVSGSYDCTARVWSLLTGECLLILQGHFQQIYSIAFNGEYIITGSLDSTCRLWSPVTGACLATLQGHTQLVGQLQLSGDSLMTGGGDGFMYLWNLRTFECQYRVQAHDQSVTSLCFDPKRIVTGGNDGAVKLWDRQTGKFVRLLTKTDAAIWRVAICEERVVICMQKNGRTAMEVMCFDSEVPILPPPPPVSQFGGSDGGNSDGSGLYSSVMTMSTAASVQHEVQNTIMPPRLWGA